MIKEVVSYVRSHAKELTFLVAGLLFSYVLASFLIVQKHAGDIYSSSDAFPTQRVGIVFGAGFTDEGPLEPLQDRLDTAKKILDAGKVEILLLSGDNRTLDYNEPQVMQDYLIERGVDEAKLQQDLAGRSTFETCERANKVFGLESAVLISQETHLPRALYLCEHFGIESVGVTADGSGSSARRFLAQSGREVFARAKAVFNAYIVGEDTILGNPINL